MVDSQRRDLIADQLDAIEAEHQVAVLYACESGSRAWGFPSTDSDYDVRFVYVHPRDWHLSLDLERRDDTIHAFIEAELERQQAVHFPEAETPPGVGPLNTFFRSVLDRSPSRP